MKRLIVSVALLLMVSSMVMANEPRMVWEKGIASWYGEPYHGRRAADGSIYNMWELTAAHRTLPFGTMVVVWNLENNRSVTVKITDRGPFVKGRIIDVSRKAADILGFTQKGIVRVRICYSVGK